MSHRESSEGEKGRKLTITTTTTTTYRQLPCGWILRTKSVTPIVGIVFVDHHEIRTIFRKKNIEYHGSDLIAVVVVRVFDSG